MTSDRTKFMLDEDRIPRAWYNIVADLPFPPAAVLHPGTGQPIGPADLAPLFPMAVIAQEVSVEREIEIPEPVREAYRLYRPSPLYRARRLEKALDTPPTSTTSTRASARAAATSRTRPSRRPSTTRKRGSSAWRPRPGPASGGPRWRSRAPCSASRSRSTWSARATTRSRTGGCSWRPTARRSWPARSPTTAYGRSCSPSTPDSPGSLGIAISEAVEDAASRDDTKYSLGSVLNHVLLHQTVVGLEALEQFALAGEEPDILIACTGGGSNFGGFTFPFVGRKLRGESNVRVIAAEPEAAPSLTRGVYAYDFGDTAKLTPMVKMHTLGHDFIPEPIHAGGLRYHGMAPLVSLLKDRGLIEARAVHQNATFAAGVQFARTEGILPAPESNHAIRVAIDEAIRCREEGVSRVIRLQPVAATGTSTSSAYERYLAGALDDFEYSAEKVAEALAELPVVGRSTGADRPPRPGPDRRLDRPRRPLLRLGPWPPGPPPATGPRQGAWRRRHRRGRPDRWRPPWPARTSSSSPRRRRRVSPSSTSWPGRLAPRSGRTPW